MHSVVITLLPDENAIIPVSYNSYLQGFIYSCLKENMGFLHDIANENNKNYRFFVFGPLVGDTKLDSNKMLHFSGLVTWEIRSLSENLIDEIVNHLKCEKYIRFCNANFRLLSIKYNDEILIDKINKIEMLSPLTAHLRSPDGSVVFLEPNNDNFLMEIKNNIRNKAETLGLDPNKDINILFDKNSARKMVTKFKNSYITAWYGQFLVDMPYEYKFITYYSGLGNKNSQGFGLYKMIGDK